MQRFFVLLVVCYFNNASSQGTASNGICLEILDSIEFYSLKTDSTYTNFIVTAEEFEKNSDTIVIQTKSNKLIFKNKTGEFEEDKIEYFRIGNLNRINKQLVFASYYENGEYLLIDNKTSKIDTLIGIPLISTNNDFILSNNIYTGMDIVVKDSVYQFLSVFQLYRIKKCSLDILSQAYFNFIPTKLKWKDNDTVFIEGIDSRTYYKLMSGKSDFDKRKRVYYQLHIDADCAKK